MRVSIPVRCSICTLLKRCNEHDVCEGCNVAVAATRKRLLIASGVIPPDPPIPAPPWTAIPPDTMRHLANIQKSLDNQNRAMMDVLRMSPVERRNRFVRVRP